MLFFCIAQLLLRHNVSKLLEYNFRGGRPLHWTQKKGPGAHPLRRGFLVLRGIGRLLALPDAQSNPWLASIGELYASCFENLTKAGHGTGAYFFASLKAQDCLGSNPRGDR
jgi:hypothetical protein